MINGSGFACEIALRWMSLDLTDDKSTLAQVMAWCHQATSHYLSWCWPRSVLPYGVTRPHGVNSLWPMPHNHELWGIVVAQWCYMATYICVYISSNNGLLPDGTKPLSEPILPYHQRGSPHSIKSNFTRSADELNPKHVFEDYMFEIISMLSRGQWINWYAGDVSLKLLEIDPGFIEVNLLKQ